ncbi:hypothetical protein ACVWYH_009991 [Bradyrhizobium sp. GM24.11]
MSTDPDRDPADQRDEGDHEQAPQRRPKSVIQRRKRQHQRDGGQTQRQLGRSGGALDKDAHQRKPGSERTIEQPDREPIERQRKQNRPGDEGETDKP